MPDQPHSRAGRGASSAVVLGGSMAGLLAARVLAESYMRVTVVERDQLPAAAGHRRGVPQGRHVHALTPRERELVEELFEGFSVELVAAGARRLGTSSRRPGGCSPGSG